MIVALVLLSAIAACFAVAVTIQLLIEGSGPPEPRNDATDEFGDSRVIGLANDIIHSSSVSEGAQRNHG